MSPSDKASFTATQTALRLDKAESWQFDFVPIVMRRPDIVHLIERRVIFLEVTRLASTDESPKRPQKMLSSSIRSFLWN